MKTITRSFLLSCLLTAALWAANVTGRWTANMQMPNGNSRTVTMNLKADGDKLTGTVSGRGGETEITDGKVTGDDISFSVVREFNGNQLKLNYKGKVSGDTIHFTVNREGGEGQGFEFNAKRAGS